MSAGDYWDRVGNQWLREQPHRLWREYTDRHQLALIERWLGMPRPGEIRPAGMASSASLLKTDLFDEVAGRGLVAHLLKTGTGVTGIDISATIVAEAARRNAGLEAVVADVRSLPFAGGSFEKVFSGSTLDHFESVAGIRAALREIRRVTRPGGRLLLTMDNPENPIVRLRRGPLLRVLRRTGIVPYQLGVTLGRRDLVATVTEAGFEVVEAIPTLHCLRVIAVALAGSIDRMGGVASLTFLRCLAACERLGSLPTRWLTGHYIVIDAVAASASSTN